MAVQTIQFEVGVGGISPATEQFGGTQGDHFATALSFTLQNSLYQQIQSEVGEGQKAVYRFDAYNGEGAVLNGEPHDLTTASISFCLTEPLTRFGGKIRVILVLSVVTTEDATAQLELFSFPALLFLKDRPEAINADPTEQKSLSALAAAAKQSALTAASAQASAEQSAQAAADCKITSTEIADGELIVTYADETTKNLGNVIGPKGDTGATGAAGEKGEDGVTQDISGKMDVPYMFLATPCTFTDSYGGTLKEIQITGASAQIDTPTPTSPIAIQNTGSTLHITSQGQDDTNAKTYEIALTDSDGAALTLRQGDVVRKTDGVWKLIQNTKVITLKGVTNEWWGTYETYKGFNIEVTDKKIEKYGDGLCTRFSKVSSVLNQGILFGFENDYLYFSQVYTDSMTVAEWKQQLADWNTAGDPLLVQYTLAAPIEHTLSDAASAQLDTISAQKGTANIFFTNETTPIMTAHYPQDLQLHCKALEARIEALENLQ